MSVELRRTGFEQSLVLHNYRYLMPPLGDRRSQNLKYSKALRILFEGHNLALTQGTGIATYARTLVAAARSLGYETEVLVGTNRAIDKRDPTLAEVTLFDGPRNLNLIHKGKMELRRLFGAPFGIIPGILDRIDGVVSQRSGALDGFGRIHGVPFLIDVERLHFMRHGKRMALKVERPPDLFHATRPAPIKVSGAANIYTIHDLVPLRLPSTTADDKAYHLSMVRELARSADHIVTVSEFSRRDIIKLTGIAPNRITNTYQPVELPEHIIKQSDDHISDMLETNYSLGFKDYFLFVGAIEPKKNISRLIDAYAASGVKRPLVIAGRLGWMYETDIEKIADERFLSYSIEDKRIVPHRRVRRLSYLPYNHLMATIRGARALLFPSLYEGFGLPVLEAMTLGTPVMSSNTTSLAEISANATSLVDPYDIASMAEAIRRLDRDDDYCSELRLLGLARANDFSVENYRGRIQDIYARVLG